MDGRSAFHDLFGLGIWTGPGIASNNPVVRSLGILIFLIANTALGAQAWRMTFQRRACVLLSLVSTALAQPPEQFRVESHE